MKIHPGFKIVSAAAAFALAGCMTAQEDTPARASNAEKVKFIELSTAPLAKDLATGAPSNEEIVKQLEAIGCPKLAKLFQDFSHYTGQEEFPQSFADHLACFGLSAAPTVEEIDGMQEKFLNPTELLDCICGGSALSDLYNKDYLKWETFSGQASAAASSTFDGKSGAAGGNFDGKASAGGSGFDGKGSIGGTFDGK